MTGNYKGTLARNSIVCQEWVQLEVGVNLDCLLIAPIVLPLTIATQNAKGQHFAGIFYFPPCPGDLQSALNDITVGAFDLARADGQPSSQGAFVIQGIGSIGDIAIASTA